MLTKSNNELAIKLHSSLDIILTSGSFIWAYFIRKYFLAGVIGGLPQSPNYYIILLIIIIIWFILFELAGSYSSYFEKSFAKIFLDIVKVVGIGTVLLILLLYIFKIHDVSRLLIGIFFLLNIGVLTISKRIIYNRYVKEPASEYKFHNILIVGSKERARDVISAIGSKMELDSTEKSCPDTDPETIGLTGYKIIGCIDLDEKEVGKPVIHGFEVIGALNNLDQILLDNPVDELFIAMPINLIKRVEEHIAFAGKIGIPVRIIPDWQIKDLIINPAISFIEFEMFSGLATIVLSTVPPGREALLIKYGIDYIFSAVACVLLSPLFLLVSIAVKVSSRGPVFTNKNAAASMDADLWFINSGP